MTRLRSIAFAGLAAAACHESRARPGAQATASEPAPASDAAVDGKRGDEAADGAGATASLPREFEVPRARAAIRPTGHFRIALWDGAPSTGTLLDGAGNGAVPVSESRFLWGNGELYVFFYAGNLDLEARVVGHDGPIWKDDSVELAFANGADGGTGDRERVIRVSVKGVVSDGLCPPDAANLSDSRCNLRWESGARAATDFDGTLNDIADRDEEWAVEAAIPLASIGAAKSPGTRIPVRMSRCGIAHDGPRECGAWEGTLVLGSEPPAGTAVRDR